VSFAGGSRFSRQTALAVSSVPQGEANRLVTLFGEDGQFVRGIAHGARKPGSRFGAALEAGSLIRVSLRRSGPGTAGLATIAEAVLLEPFVRLKGGLVGLGALFDFLGLMQYVCRDNSGDERLFGQVTGLLRLMESRPELVATFAPRSRFIALGHLGRMPDWESCSDCSAPEPRHLAGGGVYCDRCAAGRHERGRVMTDGAVAVLAMLARGEEPGACPVWGEVDAILAWLLERSGMMD